MAESPKKGGGMLRIDKLFNRILVAAMLGFIKVYRYFLSPWVGNQCRFYPTCSHYAEVAFKEHGFIKGLGLSIIRIAKCNPWHKGGLDEVPARNKAPCAHQHSHH